MKTKQLLPQDVNVTVIKGIDIKNRTLNQSEEAQRGQAGRKVENLVGQRFGMLTVLERVQNRNKQIQWKCRCDCGEYTTASSRSLKAGKKKSCGCLRKRGLNRKDLTGKKYGRLTALYPLGKLSRRRNIVWRCRCDCGNEVDVASDDLTTGNTRSCGCLKIESQKMIRDRLSITDGTCIEWLEGRKMRLDNKSGCKGVTQRKNGKYCVSIGFKKKIYYLGIFDDYESAVEARKKGEEMIHGTFLKSYALWKKMNDESPGWGDTHPFRFDVSKENGKITIYNSMEEYGVSNSG